MKKILGLALAAVLVMAMVGGGTWAYFSDTETSSSNQIVAGTLDLDLNGGDTNVNILTSLTNKAPGDSGTLYATIKNSGSIAGELEIYTGAITNTESSGGTEYEADGGNGELGANAEIAPWIDLNEDDVFDAASDIALKSDGTVSTAALQWDYADNFASKNWDVVIAAMAPAAQERIQISWRIGTGVGNTIQGDSFTLGFTFLIEQGAAD